MLWEDEQWVRAYCRDEADFLALPWQARGLFFLLIRKVDRAGMLQLGKLGLRAVAIVLHADWDELKPFLQALLNDGSATVTDDCRTLYIPNYVRAQTAAQSDAARQQARRDRLKAAKSAAPATSDVKNVTRVTPLVTRVTHVTQAMRERPSGVNVARTTGGASSQALQDGAPLPCLGELDWEESTSCRSASNVVDFTSESGKAPGAHSAAPATSDVKNVTRVTGRVTSRVEKSREDIGERDAGARELRDGEDQTEAKNPGTIRALPEDWSPKAWHFDEAKLKGFSQDFVRHTAEQFRSHAKATARGAVNWDEAFRAWLWDPRTQSQANAFAKSQPSNGGACERELVSQAMELWRERYRSSKRRYGAYVESSDCSEAMRKTAALAVGEATRELEARGTPKAPLGPLFIEVMDHWFKAYLRNDGRNGFLVDARHALRFLPRELTAYGTPWSKERAVDLNSNSGPASIVRSKLDALRSGIGPEKAGGLASNG